MLTSRDLYLPVTIRAKTVSRWAGKRGGGKKKLDSIAQRPRSILLDRPSYSTSSDFSEARRFMQGAALSSMQEGFDCEGEIE